MKIYNFTFCAWRRHDFQRIDTQNNDAQHNNKLNATLSLTAEVLMLGAIYTECHLWCHISVLHAEYRYAECRHAECRGAVHVAV
jgi:hypothetical protein